MDNNISSCNIIVICTYIHKCNFLLLGMTVSFFPIPKNNKSLLFCSTKKIAI